MVGNFRNGGREWQPQGEPEQVQVHDFMDKKLGKAILYGVYDLAENQGWVSVDTATASRWGIGLSPEIINYGIKY